MAPGAQFEFTIDGRRRIDLLDRAFGGFYFAREYGFDRNELGDGDKSAGP
jgi:hypothetical protein